jgi:hypothetical protein
MSLEVPCFIWLTTNSFQSPSSPSIRICSNPYLREESGLKVPDDEVARGVFLADTRDETEILNKIA